MQILVDLLIQQKSSKVKKSPKKKRTCMCEKGVDLLIGRPAELAMAIGVCPKLVDRQIGRAKNSKIQTVYVKKSLIC